MTLIVELGVGKIMGGIVVSPLKQTMKSI